MPLMGFRSLCELQAFVARLDVPEERREIVEAELLDHFFARVAAGKSEEEALEAFGEAEALRIRFEPVEQGFLLTRRRAVRDALVLSGAWLGACALAWGGHAWGWTLTYGPSGLGSLLGYRSPLLPEASRATAFGVWLQLGVVALALLLAFPRGPSVFSSHRSRIRSEPFAPYLYVLIVTATGWVTLLPSFQGLLDLLWRTHSGIIGPVFGTVAALMWGPVMSILLSAHGGAFVETLIRDLDRTTRPEDREKPSYKALFGRIGPWGHA